MNLAQGDHWQEAFEYSVTRRISDSMACLIPIVSTGSSSDSSSRCFSSVGVNNVHCDGLISNRKMISIFSGECTDVIAGEVESDLPDYDYP
jgi:hypothetical protein